MDSIDEGELVLTLTENATTVIKSITGADATPSEAGVRISQQDPSTAQLALNTAEAPMPGDAVVEEQGARVFLDSSAADTLDDKVLDASVDPQGAVEFTVIPQAGMPSPNGQQPPS
ncbi:MAG: Fe-S cluster assembly protein HesB [Kribbellaceae bacterium]|jgi:iron-sulfur cluster assembly protein|nr:Fe-S cluster assembly protein HesB [Kribbellaceae bacterium]